MGNGERAGFFLKPCVYPYVALRVFSLLQGHRFLIVSRLFFFVSANGVWVWIPGKAQRNICILKDNTNTISAHVLCPLLLKV